MSKGKLLLKLTGIMAIAIIALTTAFTATSCTPKKSAEQLALEAAQEAEIQAQIEAVASGRSGRSGRRGGGRRQQAELGPPPTEEAPFDEMADWLEAYMRQFADKTATEDDFIPMVNVFGWSQYFVYITEDVIPQGRASAELLALELTPEQLTRAHALSAEYDRILDEMVAWEQSQTPQVATLPTPEPYTPGPTPPQIAQPQTPPAGTPPTGTGTTQTPTAVTPPPQTPQVVTPQVAPPPSTGTTTTPSTSTQTTTQPRTSGIAHAPPVMDESMFFYDVYYAGAARITKYNGTATSVRIPDTINGLPVAYIGNNAFAGSRITSVIIPSSVTQIGSNVFANCKYLTSVTLQSNHLSNRTSQIRIEVGDLLFKMEMGGIGRFQPGTYTTNAPMTASFSEWTSPNEPPILSIVTQEGTTDGLSWMIINDSTVTIYDGPPASFRGAVTIPAAIQGKPVTAIGAGAFNGRGGITAVTIPSSVNRIGASAFEGCAALVSVAIPAGVTSIADATFFGCTSLASVTIPNSVTVISDLAFQKCTGLKSITIPSSVTTIGGNAARPRGGTFAGSGLTSISIPSSVTSISTVTFAGCASLASVTIGSSVTAIPDAMFSGCSSLTSVSFASPSSVRTIGKEAFMSCSSLTSITLPASVTAIDDVTRSTFSDGPANINIEPANRVYSSIDGVLFDKSGRTLVYYPKGRTEAAYTVPASVTMIGEDAFTDIPNLTSVTIGSSVTTIGDGAFRGCTSLASVTFASPSSLTTIEEEAFSWCTSLAGITIPSSVRTIGARAFAGRVVEGRLMPGSALASVTFASPSSLTAIEDEAFDACGSLTAIELPPSVRTVGKEAFSKCRNLGSVVLPPSVTTVGNYAFDHCPRLISITIGANVTITESGSGENTGFPASYDKAGKQAGMYTRTLDLFFGVNKDLDWKKQ